MSDVDCDCERNAIAEARDRNVSLDPGLGQPDDGRASLRVPFLGRAVQVSVLGCPLALPEHALSEGLSDLRLTTEVYVSLEGYARGSL